MSSTFKHMIQELFVEQLKSSAFHPESQGT